MFPRKIRVVGSFQQIIRMGWYFSLENKEGMDVSKKIKGGTIVLNK